jgi:hypothetical protein
MGRSRLAGEHEGQEHVTQSTAWRPQHCRSAGQPKRRSSTQHAQHAGSGGAIKTFASVGRRRAAAKGAVNGTPSPSLMPVPSTQHHGPTAGAITAPPAAGGKRRRRCSLTPKKTPGAHIRSQPAATSAAGDGAYGTPPAGVRVGWGAVAPGSADELGRGAAKRNRRASEPLQQQAACLPASVLEYWRQVDAEELLEEKSVDDGR